MPKHAGLLVLLAELGSDLLGLPADRLYGPQNAVQLLILLPDNYLKICPSMITWCCLPR